MKFKNFIAVRHFESKRNEWIQIRLDNSSNISNFSPSAVLDMTLCTVILLLSTCPIPCLNHLLLGDKVKTRFPVPLWLF